MRCPNCDGLMQHCLTTIMGVRLYACDRTVGTRQRHGARPCNTVVTDSGHVVTPDEPYLYRTGKLNVAGEWTGKMETCMVKFREIRT